MPSIEHALQKAREKGTNVELIQKSSEPFVPPKDYNPNPYTPESSLTRAKDGVEYFTKYWSMEMKKRDHLLDANAYIEKVNFIFQSYITVRKNFDVSVAYLIGDWLNECRKEFFPADDRKSASEWNRFLEENLCKDFKKTSANLYMRIAEKLSAFREKKLPIQKLEALAKLVDAGTDISPLIPRAEELSLAELMAFKPQKEQKALTSQQSFNKIAAWLSSARTELSKSKELNINFKDVHVSHMKSEVEIILSLLEKDK
jgi:hypothetical protein